MTDKNIQLSITLKKDKIKINRVMKAGALASGIIVVISYVIYSWYRALDPVLTLAFTAILTTLLLIIWESYNSENKKNDAIIAFNSELIENLIILLNNNKYLNKQLDTYDKPENSCFPAFKLVRVFFSDVY